MSSSSTDDETKLDIEIKVQEPIFFKTNQQNTVNKNRIREKGHFCYFCQKILCNNLARHIETIHGNEIEVAKILAMPKGSKKRRDAFQNLTKYGDFYHNCEVLATKCGDLILTRRPSLREEKYTSIHDYGPCPECLGFYLKKHIWYHLKYKCTIKLDKNLKKINEKFASKGPIAESSALLNGILGRNFTLSFTENVLNNFKTDQISNLVKSDDTILRFGAFLFEKYNTTQAQFIRQSMRQLGRLGLELKTQGEIFENFSEMLLPEKFDAIVNATKALCKTQHDDPTKKPEFQIPSLALKIGHAIKKCAAIERGQSLRKGDIKKNNKLLSFLDLLNLEWSIRISTHALSTLYLRKQTAADLLPITSDLVKLSETAKITLDQFARRPDWKSTGTEEMKNSLSPIELKLASSLTILKVIGKRGRIVPILLTKELKESVELLISKRAQFGIACENPYIFAIPNSKTSHLRGHDCLKKWCQEACLESPELITSTKLRKCVATVCQVFDLTENEYDWLARHLGHDVRVHREFYRLQENAVELTKVSRLLLAVDQGEAHKFSGKQLKDINIEDMAALNETTTMDTVSDSEDDSTHNFSEGTEQNEELVLKGKKRKSSVSTMEKTTSKKCSKRPWTDNEKKIMYSKFTKFIKKNSLPGKLECMEVIENHEVFAGRKWSDLKFFIKNHLSKIKKMSSIS
ncbi:unnamed protein product [Psylliodes chrysocephalus]|uniref:Uncharacterized protein n=1 Tax=Psylliodes chrysocephalus TaxID=3402493 RepID=A0A9P0DBD1_9CUCU|nr:unnamed protein product [Psylliodes chrysocephala]